MDYLRKLSGEWAKNSAYDSGIQQRIWDRAAPGYRELELPNIEENAFLRHMTEAVRLDQSIRTLDVGCGSGIYSMALAPYVQEAVGIDISPKMIQYARERSQKLGLTNTTFHSLDWSEADIRQMGFFREFDVVFAHMTPAVNDYETFDKLNSCSRNLCMIEKPARRLDQVQDEAFRRIGLDRQENQYHGGIPQAFSYLWYQGYCPKLYYQEDVWQVEKTIPDMTAWCTDRARLLRELTPQDEAAIEHYIESQAVDGMVREHTTTTRVTMVWHVNNTNRKVDESNGT